MKETTRQVLKRLIDDYGIGILEDPDRLSQFLEDRCPSASADNFRLTFALRYLIKSGWTPQTRLAEKEAILYTDRLSQHLGFTKEDAEDVISNLRDAVAGQDWETEDDIDDTVVARPGNLRRISGGISNKPRTMWLRKKSFYNGLVLIASLLAIAVLFFQIGSQRNPVGDEFRIALFAPMTGSAAQSSHNQLRAAQLAVELINKNGGVRGYKLKIVGYDIPAAPQAAAENIHKIMNDRSIMVMMTGADEKFIKVISPIADEINVPLLVTSPNISVSSLMDNNKQHLYSFYIANDTDARAKMLAYFAIQGLSKKKIALIYDPDDDISAREHESILRWIRIFNGAVTADIMVPDKMASDYAAVMKVIFESGADILIVPGRQKDVRALFKQARAAGFNGTILAEGYNNLALTADSSLAGGWWIDEVSMLDPQIRSVLKDYKNLYNENCPPEDIEAAILAYDGVQWIANALYRAPGYRGEAIRHALLSTKNLSVTHATLTVDPRTHDPLNKAMALIYCDTEKGIFQRRVRVKKE